MSERYVVLKKSNCIYKGLREWLNNNRISKTDLSRMIDPAANQNTIAMLNRHMTGHTEFRMHSIKEIIRVSGKSFEELFGEVDG